MSNVEEIKVAIEALAEIDYVQLRQWFNETDWENGIDRLRQTQSQENWIF